MKRLITFLLILVSFTAKAQFPINQTIGGTNSLVKAKGGLSSDSGFVQARFNDTASANRGLWIKNIPGITIRVVDTIFMRNNAGNKWIPIGSTNVAPGSYVTSIAQGFGMNNSSNPITSTGTVAVDSNVIATRNYANTFYNDVTQLNDSTYTIDRGNGFKDTIQIQSGIASLIDSIRRVPGTTIVQARKNGAWVTMFIDSIGSGGGGSGTVTNVSRTNGYGITASVSNPTTTPDITIAVDTATVFAQLRSTIPTTDTSSLSARINLKLNAADTASLSARINLKLNAADTASLSARINLKLNAADTASLSSRINQKLNISDTAVFSRKGTWTDYSATSTITGWSSYTTKLLQYEITDKVIRVMVQLEGTGTGTSVSFTLPVSSSSWGTQYFILQTQNNTTQSASVAWVNASSSTVTISNSASTTTSWTNGVLRNVRGQFFINIP